MKRIFSALLLAALLAGPAFGLSDGEYLRLKRLNEDFALADKRLTQVWKRFQDRMPGWMFKILR